MRTMLERLVPKSVGLFDEAVLQKALLFLVRELA